MCLPKHELATPHSCSPFRPLQPSSYIPTPPFLRKKHCLVNPRNTDNMCLLWSFLAALHPPSSNANQVQCYKRYLHTLNIDGLTFPVETKQLPLFEKLNPSISLNVLYFDRESKGFTVEYISSEREEIIILTYCFWTIRPTQPSDIMS